MTLVELLIASGIMAMMAAALGTLALAVSMGNRHSRGQSTAVQHARVVLDRIRTACLDAHASQQFPGFFVVTQEEGGWTFPETLVVWRPDDTPANPDGLPLFSEVVIFTPDPDDPRRLLEVTAPDNDGPVPSPMSMSRWRSDLSALLTQSDTQAIQLTNLLRTPSASESVRRAAVRFHVVLRPSDDDLSDYEAGRAAWSDVPWAQNLRGTEMGMRQTWCRMELQLMPGEDAARDDPDGAGALTFFGSAAIYYGLTP